MIKTLPWGQIAIGAASSGPFPLSAPSPDQPWLLLRSPLGLHLQPGWPGRGGWGQVLANTAPEVCSHSVIISTSLSGRLQTFPAVFDPAILLLRIGF